MALLQKDRATLARMTHALSKRVADKKASRQLASLTNKLTHNNPISPTDQEMLTRALEAMLALPLPKFPVKFDWIDLLGFTLLRKLFRKARLIVRARASRAAFRDILTRL